MKGKYGCKVLVDFLRHVDLYSGVVQSTKDKQRMGSLSLKVLKLPGWTSHGGSLGKDGWVCCSQILTLLLPVVGSGVFSQNAKLCFYIMTTIIF